MLRDDEPSGRLILVVDDDADIREVAAAALSLVGGFRVLTADSGSAALALAASAKPDAILLDVMMPKLSGHQTLALLQEDAETRDIPVVLLTASSTSHPACYEGGTAVGVIGKPFDPMTLSAELIAMLRWTD